MKLLYRSEMLILTSKTLEAGGIAVSGQERTQNSQYLGSLKTNVKGTSPILSRRKSRRPYPNDNNREHENPIST